MLSIIVPVYNVEDQLAKCLNSILNQTYKDIEIILINDGSTDNSSEICRRYADMDSRIIYRDKTNEGSGATRNLGIRLATGQFITFIDSDDWWSLDYAEEMMKDAEHADIVISDMIYVEENEDGTFAETLSAIRMPNKIAQCPNNYPDLINRARTFLCGKIFRKTLFTDNNIWQPSMAINDIPIVPLLVAKSSKIIRVKDAYYYYLRNRKGNTVTSFNALFSFEYALKELKNNFEKHYLTTIYKNALYKMYYSQVRFALRKGLTAIIAGNNYSEYEELHKKLYKFLDEAWANHPTVDNSTFSIVGSDKLLEGFKLFVIDEECLKPLGESVDYLIVEKGYDVKEHQVNAKSTIYISYNTRLDGEELYWEIADNILFSIADLLKKEEDDA